jgi:hypothetical protein
MNLAEPLEFAVFMARSGPSPAPRYSYERVSEEIHGFLNRKRGNQARLAEALGIDSGTFRHRMNQKQGQRFSIEDISTIAEVAHAPRGWPWLSWKDAEEFEAYLKLSPAAREVLQAASKGGSPT